MYVRVSCRYVYARIYNIDVDATERNHLLQASQRVGRSGKGQIRWSGLADRASLSVRWFAIALFGYGTCLKNFWLPLWCSFCWFTCFFPSPLCIDSYSIATFLLAISGDAEELEQRLWASFKRPGNPCQSNHKSSDQPAMGTWPTNGDKIIGTLTKPVVDWLLWRVIVPGLLIDYDGGF